MNRRDSQRITNTTDKKIGYFGRIREYDSMVHLIEAAKIANFEVILAGDGLAVGEVHTTSQTSITVENSRSPI